MVNTRTRTLTFLLALAVLAAAVLKVRPTVYTNGGGFADEGARLSIFSSGRYKLQTYTDQLEQPPRHREEGTFKRDLDSFALRDSRTGKKTIYHIVQDQFTEYLLRPEAYDKYTNGVDLRDASWAQLRRERNPNSSE